MSSGREADFEPLQDRAHPAARVPPAGRLHRRLSSFGVLLLALSCLSPVASIYGGGSDVFQHAGSGAAALFVLGIGVAVVWAAVYGELGSAYPHAGGDYVGVGAILGPGAAIMVLAWWAAFCIPSAAFSARIVAQYVVALFPTLSPVLISCAALAAAVAVALLTVRRSALVTGLFLGIEMLAVLALLGAGLVHPVRRFASVLWHPQVLGAAGTLVPVSVAVMALGAVTAAYNTVGGNQAMFFGEELRQPHRHMGRVIVVACLIGAFATALPIVCFVLSARDLAAAMRSPVPFSALVASVAGPAAGRALSAGVALAIFNCLIVEIMLAARLFFSLGCDRIAHERINRLLGQVPDTSGVPRNATLLVGALTAVCCLLDAHVLLIFLAGTTAYIFGLVCLAVLVGRARGLTAQPGYWRSPLFPLAPLLGLCVAAMMLLADLFDAQAGRPSTLINAALAAAALLWYRFVLQRRPGGWRPRAAMSAQSEAAASAAK